MSAGDSQKAKKELRNQVLQKLNTISFHELIQKSQNFRDLFSKNVFLPHKDVLVNKFAISFCPFTSEPQLNLEMFDLKIGYVRILNWELGLMDSAEARRDMPGQWHDFSPQPGVQVFQPTDAQPTLADSEIALILIPGLAFDRSGRRLGRGKGFYDRYLKTIPHALRVGVVFHEQMVPKLEDDPWDEPVDAILTDREWIETERFGYWKKHGIVKR